MDLNSPVFATGVHIFRASNDVGSWVHTNTRILEYCFFLVFVWTQDPTSLSGMTWGELIPRMTWGELIPRMTWGELIPRMTR
jgi:hypothetical protein